MTTRRKFISLLGGATVAWPVVARAQQSGMPVIGFLNGVSFHDYADQTAAILLGLRDTGFIEGRNVTIVYRSADGSVERLPALAEDLVRRQVGVIIAIGTGTPAKAAQAATSTIPIVFAMGGDALEYGLVKSLNRPGANVTGMSFGTSQLAPKRLELVRELAPRATRIGYLVNSSLSPSAEPTARELMAAAETMGRQVIVLDARTDEQIDEAFAKAKELSVGALVVAPDAFLTARRSKIVASAARYAIPAVYSLRSIVVDGGLMCYGVVTADLYRQVGVYAGRILKGEKPGDLPVQQPTKFQLVINLKTAKALGLNVPPMLLARADEVIE